MRMNFLLRSVTLLPLLLCGGLLCSGPAVAQSAIAQGAKPEAAKPLLKASDHKSLNKALKNWFKPQIQAVELVNAGATKSRSGRNKVKKLRKEARKARKKFNDAFDKKGQKVGGLLRSVPDLLRIFDSCFPMRSPFSSGKLETAYIDKKAKNGKFFLLRPATTKDELKGKNKPLILCLGGRSADKWEASDKRLTSLWGGEHALSKRAIFCSPEMDEGLELEKIIALEKADSTEEGRILWFFGTMRAVFDRYPIDTDRVFLDAEGDSTPFALRLVSLFPDRFAGVILRDPKGAENLTAENVLNLGILIVASKDSPGAENLTKKLADAKHGSVTRIEAKGESPLAENSKDVAEWISKQKRDTFPKRVVIVPAHDKLRKAYWVRIREAEFLTQVALSDRPRIEVIANRAENRIEVKAHNVTQIQLFFNDTLLDLDKDIVLVLNGKIQKERRTRSLRTLTELVLKKNDPRFIYVAGGSYNIPAPASEEGKDEAGTEGSGR